MQSIMVLGELIFHKRYAVERMEKINDKITLLAYMSQGAIIVTPNNRLSRQLLNDYGQSVTEKLKTIPKPLCFSYQHFLEHWFNQIRHRVPSLDHPLLLSNHQQRHLWQQIIQKQSSYPCSDGLVNEIQDAWKRCQYWHIHIDDPAFFQTPQTRQFQQWQHLFQSKLTQQAAITAEQLASYVSSFPMQLAKHSAKIIWVCFDDYTPQQQTTQQILTNHGYQLYHYDLARAPSVSFQYPAIDQPDEYQQMITWIQSRLAAGDQRIGIVVPDIQTHGTMIQRLFDRHLSDNQFNLSLGKKLTDFPLVAHALHWLQLNQTELTNHQAHLLLSSPYLAGSQTEYVARTDLHQNGHLLREAQIPFTEFLNTYQTKIPILATALIQIESYPDHASLLTWINLFKQRLSQLGFPGEYTLDSAQYQCLQRLLNLFDDWMTYAIVTPSMSRQQAIATLSDLAKNTIFQLKQPTTPVLVLGLLEASGCHFDSIWVTGLTDQCLPQKIKLSGFIPLHIQRTHQMPHASVDKELQLAKQLIDRLLQACQTIIFSYPQLLGDLPNLPSPLIVHLPLYKALPIISPSQPLLEIFSEDYQLPLLPSEKVTGGTSLLANQAKCPFRAFSAHRLHANERQNDVSFGLDASERGKILHHMMELFWQQVGSHQQLKSMTQTVLNQLVQDVIMRAIHSVTRSKYQSFPLIAQEVEYQRLYHLIGNILDFEKQRPPFIVEKIEQSFTINLAGLDFQIRVDRLDRVIDQTGSSDSYKMVIDYKSTLPSTKPWKQTRPEAPQLLLYALLDDHIKALLLMELKSGHVCFQGLSEKETSIPCMQSLNQDETWSSYQHEWQQQLSNLAEEFKQGLCSPRPSKAETCSKCAFQNLCRITI